VEGVTPRLSHCGSLLRRPRAGRSRASWPRPGSQVGACYPLRPSPAASKRFVHTHGDSIRPRAPTRMPTSRRSRRCGHPARYCQRRRPSCLHTASCRRERACDSAETRAGRVAHCLLITSGLGISTDCTGKRDEPFALRQIETGSPIRSELQLRALTRQRYTGPLRTCKARPFALHRKRDRKDPQTRRSTAGAMDQSVRVEIRSRRPINTINFHRDATDSAVRSRRARVHACSRTRKHGRGRQREAERCDRRAEQRDACPRLISPNAIDCAIGLRTTAT